MSRTTLSAILGVALFAQVTQAAPLLDTTQEELRKHYQQGRDYFHQHLYEEAEEEFRQVTALNPEYEFAATYLELCRMKQFEKK